LPLVSFATPVTVTEQIGGFTSTPGEDADYITSTPSYTKIDADGSDLPDEATTWAMVRDNVRG